MSATLWHDDVACARRIEQAAMIEDERGSGRIRQDIGEILATVRALERNQERMQTDFNHLRDSVGDMKNEDRNNQQNVLNRVSMGENKLASMAEDLNILTQDVKPLRDLSMKIVGATVVLSVCLTGVWEIIKYAIWK